jgi:hypothetical protein
MDSLTIFSAVRDVTKTWHKQRKAEERNASATLRRRDAMTRTRRVTLKDAAYDVMPSAYAKASDGGKLPAHARQIMYAARPAILDRTGEDKLDDQYFCQTLLPDYIAEHQHETAGWDVAFDARGHFEEPHTRLIVPLGTLEVRGYLHEVKAYTLSDLFDQLTTLKIYQTIGPEHRFNGILFIEKEGFLPLFKRVKLAARHDIAIMSTKGMSVTASRSLVDVLCSMYRVPLLVLHDFDKAGFSIVGTLRRDTRRYEFKNDIRVIDLGLRLEDIEGLPTESVSYGIGFTTRQAIDPGPNLRRNGATPEEADFIRGRRGYGGYHGQRIELNAFTSRQLVDWIEAKLKHHGITKVIPDGKTLEVAYRRAMAAKHFTTKAKKLTKLARQVGAKVVLPDNLDRRVRSFLKRQPDLPWEEAIRRIAAKAKP